MTTERTTDNPLIPMFRQAGNGPHDNHKQSDNERLEDWRMRMLRSTGIEPSRKPYRVAYCKICGAPVWYLDPKHEHMNAVCTKHGAQRVDAA